MVNLNKKMSINEKYISWEKKLNWLLDIWKHSQTGAGQGKKTPFSLHIVATLSLYTCVCIVSPGWHRLTSAEAHGWEWHKKWHLQHCNGLLVTNNAFLCSYSISIEQFPCKGVSFNHGHEPCSQREYKYENIQWNIPVEANPESTPTPKIQQCWSGCKG